MIDWRSFLDKHHIDYVERRANIYVHCCWCGDDDQGQHLGIHLGRGKSWRGYGCWRDQRHRGRDPGRLVGGLLGISLAQARAIVGGRGEASPPGSNAIKERVKAMKGLHEKVTGEVLRFPKEVIPLHNEGQGRLFIDYIKRRGYTTEEATELCFRYKLRYAMKGPFAYRIIIPIYNEFRELMTWTGRTIVDEEPIRYNTLSVQETEKMPKALAPITDLIFNEGELIREAGNGLVVCEGPFDALKVDFFCNKTLGVRGTCLFGRMIYDNQVVTLAEIAPFYGKKVLLLDQDAKMARWRVHRHLKDVGYKMLDLPLDYKDPGEMPKRDLLRFIEKSVALRG